MKWFWYSLCGSDEQEIRAEEDVGTDLAAKLLRQMPPDPDEQVQLLVQRLGGRLSESRGARNRQFKFQVVQSPLANAYALPGGRIFVTRGLLDLCACDGDETAFSLAHEMEHIVCRHCAEQRRLSIMLAAMKAGKTLRDVFGKGYSREQEREADLKAVDLAGGAGFRREAALRVLEKLRAAAPETSEFREYFSTHPRPEDRLSYLADHLRTNGTRLA